MNWGGVLPGATSAEGITADLDPRHNLLFVAGGQGKGYVYSTRMAALVASYDLGAPRTSLINGVTVTPFGAWFSDSLQPRLYFVSGVDVPGADGLVLEGRRLWAVHFDNRVTKQRRTGRGDQGRAVRGAAHGGEVRQPARGGELASGHRDEPTYEVVVVDA